VNVLHITYNPNMVPLLQQLPLSTAPLAGLARLEVEGPDSLVTLAPVLPQLVALTHMRASIDVMQQPGSSHLVFSSMGVPLEVAPAYSSCAPA
jgi:hypothetical protein